MALASESNLPSTPLVSVLVPLFNGERWVRSTLLSVLSQTMADYEIIVVDDGSNDQGPQLVELGFPSVRLLRQPNAGTAAARNTGLRHTRGQFIALLDQDDVWHPEKLESQVQALQADPQIEMSLTLVDEFQREDSENTGKAPIRERRKAAIGAIPSASLIRRGTFERVGYFDTNWKLGEWAEWYIRFKRSGGTLSVVRRALTLRRLHAANKGISLSTDRIEYTRILRSALASSPPRSQAPTGG